MELSFRGTAYNGWQVQPNAVGVQQVIEESLAVLIKEKIRLTGAGRTDTGVHASFFVAHFDLASEKILNPGETEHRLNHILPADIAVSSVFPVDPSDHSRYSAISRTYKYFVSLRKDPFRQDTSNQVYFSPDIDLMDRAARLLPDYDDFGSFCRSNSGAKTHICRITEAKWEVNEGLLVFTITADRFLRNMVRAITGTILDVGSGKLSLEGFREIIEARDRRMAGTSAPARGLFLTEIEYPPRILEKKLEFYRHT
jgi:tRNA pseudouridine38-40 synthase